MPNTLRRLLNAAWVLTAARVLVTFPYWSGGLSKTFAFSDGVAEMALYGLNPPIAFNLATIACMLIGSVLVIINRFAWIGASALAVFTMLTIPIVHDFWNMSAARAQTELFFVVEHIGLIGGLLLAAILSGDRRDRVIGAEVHP